MPIARLHTASTSQTTTQNQTAPPSTTTTNQDAIVLRHVKPKSDKKISWSEAVEDNEFKNMRTSKSLYRFDFYNQNTCNNIKIECCIFHKKKEFGESDSESDSDAEEHDCHDPSCEHHTPESQNSSHVANQNTNQ